MASYNFLSRAADNFSCTDGDDTIGTSAFNMHIPVTVDGKSGYDIVTFYHPQSNYTVVTSGNKTLVTGVIPLGTMNVAGSTVNLGNQYEDVTLYNCEEVRFSYQGKIQSVSIGSAPDMSGNNLITASAQGGAVDGGGGVDTVSFSLASSTCKLGQSGAGYTVTSSSGVTTTLVNIERIQFSDKTVALDINGNAGQAYRVYQAAFNRTPDNAGLKYWINSMDQGTTLQQVASGFLGSAEFKTQYGANPSVADFVNKLYQNVLHRAGEQSGVTYWNNELNTGHQSMAQVLAGFSESPENQAAVIGFIQNGISLT